MADIARNIIDQPARSRFVIHALLWGMVLYFRFFITIFFAVITTTNFLFGHGTPSALDILITVALIVA